MSLPTRIFKATELERGQTMLSFKAPTLTAISCLLIIALVLPLLPQPAFAQTDPLAEEKLEYIAGAVGGRGTGVSVNITNLSNNLTKKILSGSVGLAAKGVK
jgi:hypothetical protein